MFPVSVDDIVPAAPEAAAPEAAAQETAIVPSAGLGPRFDAAAIVDQVYAAVKHSITHKISPANVIIVITVAMQTVERVKGATSVQKKEVVLAVVERLVDEIDDSETRSAVSVAVQMLAPSIIDAVVSAANGKIDIGHAVKQTKNCLRGVFSCCSKST